MQSFNFLLPNIVLVVTFLTILLDKLPRVVVALLGAGILLVTKNITQEEAFSYIDFNVIFLLVGMMIMVNILNETGGIKWLAIFTAKRTNGNSVKLLIYLSLLTAILSAFLDNVTTVIFLGAITYSICKELKISPSPFLISEIICSNIGGTATLIGDPPNIMIGSAAKLTFDDFIIHLTPLILIVLFFAICTLILIYKNELSGKNKTDLINKLSLEKTITNRPLLIKSVIVISLTMIGFFLHSYLKLEAGTIAITGAAVLLIFENKKDIWNDVEWTTIFFFIGLFIIVGAVEKSGTINHLSQLALKISNGDFKILTLTILWLSAILSSIIDNIPYTATMIPMIQSFKSQFSNIQPLWWALSLGACLGGNGTLLGASANIVAADIANKLNCKISFLEFFKVGFIITIESLLISSVYLYFRYLQ